jgi:hypothetical protein
MGLYIAMCFFQIVTYHMLQEIHAYCMQYHMWQEIRGGAIDFFLVLGVVNGMCQKWNECMQLCVANNVLGENNYETTPDFLPHVTLHAACMDSLPRVSMHGFLGTHFCYRLLHITRGKKLMHVV